MKPLYIGIAIVVLIIIFLVVKSNQNKKQAEANQQIANANPNYNTSGQSSQVAQIINSLLPFFQTGVAAATSNQNSCPSGQTYNQQLKMCVQITQS